MGKYLDENGLRQLWSRINAVFAKKTDVAQIATLLGQVKTALENGDTQQAISLLDSFLLDSGVIE